ncbi:MAG: hypothetical protein AAF499_08105 [Pseudomonadota bacterium]
MKQSDADSNPEMEMLRNILLGEERRELDDVRRQLDAANDSAKAANAQLAQLTQLTEALQARADDQSAFVDATADALPEALKRAGKSDSSAVSRALSPYVVASIRKEIVNSRDEMVDALYPITGRLVTAAVRNAIAKLSEDINERMSALTSSAMWRARVQAWRTGEPVSKFVLASGGDFRVLRAMLLDRGAGTPLSVAESEDVPERSDTNLISGLLAALSNLAQEVYTSAEDELRRVDLNGRQIAFRRSASQLLVVEFIGRLPAEVQAEIDRRFVDIVALGESDNQRALDAEVAALLTLRLQQDSGATRSEVNPYVKWSLIGILVLTVGWLLGTTLGRWQLDRAASNVQGVVNADASLRSYPITVSAQHDSGELIVRGLVPQSVSEDSLRTKLREAAGSVPFEIAVSTFANRQDVSQSRDEMLALQRENQRLQKAVSHLQSQLGEQDHSNLPADVLALSEQVRRIDSVLSDRLEVLKAAALSSVIRFDAGVELADSEQAHAALKRLVTYLNATPSLLVIQPVHNPSSGDADTWAIARARYVRTQMLSYGADAVQLSIAAPRTPTDVDDALSVVFAVRSAGDAPE